MVRARYDRQENFRPRRDRESAIYLEINNRDESGVTTYPDVELGWNGPETPGKYAQKDGRPFC